MRPCECPSMDRSAIKLLHIALCLTVLVVETYSSISWAREILYRTKRQDVCQYDEFRCTSGECINAFTVCDGTKDCADGSDETEISCKPLNTTDTLFLVRGRGCPLPQPLEFGNYTAPTCGSDDKSPLCRLVPGTPAPENWILSFKCNEGYYFKDTRDGKFNAFCDNGEWSPKIPVCRKMCPPLVSLNAAVICFNEEGDVPCRNPMEPGTRARSECKPSYTLIWRSWHSEIICRDNGQWSHELLNCQLACGKRNRQGPSKPLITNGTPTIDSEFPWHVGIYQRNASNEWEQICGGSLISPHIVLTAAHCVFSEQQKIVLPPNEFKVGLGKYYREWKRDEPNAVKADVRTILISPLYKGQATSYADDVALIDLTESVKVGLHASIMPVCVDWKHEFTVTPGTLGTLAGWGRTKNFTPSDVLLYADLPYIDYRHCIDGIPQVLRHYVTPDKFCAGFSNVAGAASGDCGGGLMFVRNDLHYLHGIVSNNVQDAKSFAIVTDLTDKTLLDWLNLAKHTLDEAHPETNQFMCTSGEKIDTFSVCDGTRECTDGSDETDIACKQLNIKCPQWTFKCAYGACIGVNKTCNGQADCADGSDEADCPIATTTTRLPPPSTPAPIPNLPTQTSGSLYGAVYGGGGYGGGGYEGGGYGGATISPAFAGTPIPVSFRCKDTEFKCISGECIEKLFLCDGRMDCRDGSDETRYQCAGVSIVHTLTISFSCPKSKFPCSYGACIDANKQCDGQSDCADGSDENVSACPGPTFSKPQNQPQLYGPTFSKSPAASVPMKCRETEFECAAGDCIDGFSVCDGRVDCVDGSDETELCNRFTERNQFRCTSGLYIPTFSVCDGIKDCSDGSDEIGISCKLMNTPNNFPSAPQTGECLLPQPPLFGMYTGVVCAFNNRKEHCNQLPGKFVPEDWGLVFKCNEGYYIRETQDENAYAFCVSGRWSPKIPVCRKMCSPLVSLSVDIRCFNGEDDVDCSRPMRPRTRAKGECKPSYTQILRPQYTEIICRENGQWSDELFNCKPVCGKRNIHGINNPLIVDGSPAIYGEFPWHAGLYIKNAASNQWEQKCGGSLISPHIILSAAHCVFSEQTKAKLHPEAIKVGLGKYYREWTHDEPYAVKADVRKILITSRYYGQATSYTQDIALLDLTDSVQLHAGIMPVCIDWKHEFSITNGTFGTLAGWGKTGNEKPSDVLLYVDLPFVDYRQCIVKVPQAFQRYVTSDKFCAGFSDGAGAALGDSGGGLTFVRNDLYYVYGIVSTKVKREKSFITFTNVSNVELFMWLNDAKHIFDEEHRET